MPPAKVFAVWDNNTHFLFAYVLFGMAIITQFLVPIIIFSLFSQGYLGDMGDLCNSYPEECGPNELTLSDVIKQNGFFAALCPHNYISNALLSSAEARVGAFFLFLFLLVATPVGDIVNACMGVMPAEYQTLKYSHMTEDVFFYKVSYTINMLCYISIIGTTYLLFLTSPTADNLLLNVIALQFLIDVDNIVYEAVMDETTKSNLVQKMLLSYIQNGEKTVEQAHVEPRCGICKYIVGFFLGRVAGYFGVIVYGFSWFAPFVVAYCL